MVSEESSSPSTTHNFLSRYKVQHHSVLGLQNELGGVLWPLVGGVHGEFEVTEDLGNGGLHLQDCKLLSDAVTGTSTRGEEKEISIYSK